MSSLSRPAGKLTAKELCVLSLMSALIFATKVALAAIPNVNLNAVFLILTAVFFGWKSLYTVYVYVLLEGLVYGFSIWWVGYLYVWDVLIIAVMLMRNNDSALIWAVVAAVFGIIFGPLMYIEWFAINGGWEGFFAMWVAGIPYDITHCVSNFVTVLVLYRPLHDLMSKLLEKSQNRVGGAE